ncbi:MAG: arginine--tRNA ligase [Candidatus Thermoplasmatota archaeon]|nr:arginine--tRNA ligase [Candidatus Thermoplasmatota archaeon]
MNQGHPGILYSQAFRKAVLNVLSSLAPEIEPVIEVPRFEGADLCLVCFPIAKVLRRPPKEIASEIGTMMEDDPRWKLEAAGGYLNCSYDPVRYATDCAHYLWSNLHDLGSIVDRPRKVIIEHTSANPNGPFHVGRARNPIIGDTLTRMFRAAGYEVGSQYWVNDMGKQVMILVWGIHNIDPALLPPPERDKADHRLVSFYQEANRRMEADPSVELEINSMLLHYERAVQEGGRDRVISGEGSAKVKASDVRDACESVLEGMKGSLADLNVFMDSFVYESAVVEDGKVRTVIEGLKRSSLCRKEGGAYYLDLSGILSGGDDDRFRKRFVFTRSDGTALYTTRDLAYHLWKLNIADVAINVLGEDHRYQSRMLGLALEELGSEKVPEALFYSFVSLPEGKMSTRRNKVVFLDDLLEEAISRARTEVLKRRSDLSGEEVDEISRKVGVGALRFNMIRVQPEKPITFRWEDALNFEGASAPFIQYSHARACSIIRKGGGPPPDEPDWGSIVEASERELLKRLVGYPLVLKECVSGRRPHLMAGFLVDCASSFNDFYRDCPVLLEGDAPRRRMRIGLCTLARDVISDGLHCLGIEAPQSM